MTNYNHEKEGRITTEFLEELASKSKRESTHYLVVKGYFNLEQSLSLQEILNFMYSKNYEFVKFVTLDRSIEGEMIFKSC